MLVPKQLGHVAGRDLLRQALGDGGLADAGLADQAGIVLGPAAEDLDDPVDLLLAPDDRVELVFTRHPGEIAAVLVERRGLAGFRAALGAGLVGRAGHEVVVFPLGLPACIRGLLRLLRLGVVRLVLLFGSRGRQGRECLLAVDSGLLQDA